MQKVRALPEKFARCSECDAVILPGHLVIVFAMTLIWPKGTEGPDNIRHRCIDCTDDTRWETKFDARYPGMWDSVVMTVTSATGELPEDL